MRWIVLISLSNGEEHSILCSTYEVALEKMKDLITFSLFSIIDPEAIASMIIDDLIFQNAYGKGGEPLTEDSFYVNPRLIASVEAWEVDE